MRKSIIIVALALVCSSYVSAQKIAADKVPAAVLSTFKSKFPTAQNVAWEKENAKELEAAFTIGKEKHSAAFDLAGKWMETETTMEVSAMPKAVKEAIAKQYADYKVKESVQVETPDKGSFYEADLTKGMEKLEVQFSADGKLLNAKKEK